MQQHYVTFLRPGTFVSEESRMPIETWDTDAAVRMACSIHERHGAVPYGFVFTTRLRGEADLDSREVARSGMHYLGGRIETRAQIEERDDPNESILRSNMRANDIEAVVVNENSWRFTAALKKGDVVLDVDLRAEAASASQ